MYFKRKELEKFRCFKGPLIDVRSPSEYYKGHMPNSINIPLFDNDERAIVGTIYKKNGRELAVIQGLKFVERKIDTLLETIFKSIDQISLSTSVADEREDEMIKAIDSNDLNINFENMDKVEMQDLIISFERKMKKAAENMKFEVAAIYRDKIKELKQGAVK